MATVIEAVDAIAGVGEALGQILVVRRVLHKPVNQNDSALGVGDDVLAVEKFGSELVGGFEIAARLLDLMGSGCCCGRLWSGVGGGKGRGCHDAGHCHGAGNCQ